MRPAPLAMPLVLALAWPCVACAADNGEATGLTILVRTYDASDLEPDTRSRAIGTAREILEAAGVRVVSLDCDLPPSPALQRCERPLTPIEVTVRFVRLAPEQNAAGTMLGSSFVDTRKRAGTLATIYVNRVDSLARGTGADAVVLLGRTVAHEVGHLLLGSTAHSNAGLMKAVWSRDVLLRNRARDWAFTPREALALRNAVRERTQAAAPLPLLAAQRPAD